jgi:hypothetical protein
MATVSLEPNPPDKIQEGINWRNWFKGIWTWMSYNTVSPGVPGTGAASGASSLLSTTVGAAGGASALPATPVGYYIIKINGISYKVPYYNI